MGGHESMLVRVGDMAAEIDNELVPIIQWLWKLSIKTTHCCQGDSFQFAYISFPPGPHASRFVEAMLTLGFPEQKVCLKCSPRFLRKTLGVDPNNWSWRWECEWQMRHRYGDHVLTCRFPYRDIAKIVASLEAKS